MRAKYDIWPYLSYLVTYLSVPNPVKWGVLEKILQNAVQTRAVELENLKVGKSLKIGKDQRNWI